jgi:trigger factor
MMQMAQFGNTDASEEEIEQITRRILSNQEEVKRLSEQLESEKMLAYFKENAQLEEKQVTYEEFIDMAYKQED